MKRYSEIDMALMELQKMGNDEFRMGFNYSADTKEDAIGRALKELQEYLEKHKDDEPEEAPYGYRINLEFFKKGKPVKTF